MFTPHDFGLKDDVAPSAISPVCVSTISAAARLISRSLTIPGAQPPVATHLRGWKLNCETRNASSTEHVPKLKGVNSIVMSMEPLAGISPDDGIILKSGLGLATSTEYSN
jgi:hypothetical protein